MPHEVFKTFWCSESAALTVDWVVVTAAVTGLGLSSAVAVRNGTGSLAGEINTALSGAEVAEACGAGSYTLNTMSEQAAAGSRTQVAGFTDANLVAEFSSATTKVADSFATEGTSANTGEVMDHLHLLTEEMSRRGLSPAAGVASFEQTHEAIYGSNLSGACGFGGGRVSSDAQANTYRPLILSEADAAVLVQDFARFSMAELETYLNGLDSEMGNSMATRDVQLAQKTLDHMQYLVAEIASRGERSELAVKSAQIYDASLQQYERMSR